MNDALHYALSPGIAGVERVFSDFDADADRDGDR